MLVVTVCVLVGDVEAMTNSYHNDVMTVESDGGGVNAFGGEHRLQTEEQTTENNPANYTDDSDCEEWCIIGNRTARHQRGGKRHRRWQPTTQPAPPSLQFGREAVLATILRNEHFTGDYIGDGGLARQTQNDVVRIATVNINKNLKQKMDDEVLEWTIAHCIDVLVVSDPGWEGNSVQTAWVWDEHVQQRIPGSLVFGSKRIGMILQRDRWQDRLEKKSVAFSASTRSMSIRLRLDKYRVLRVIGTYIHHSPERYEEEVMTEYRWIEQQIQLGREKNDIVLIAGDFNTPKPRTR